jgi:hypothetical protein
MPPPDLIDALVADLEPVRPAIPWRQAMVAWWVISWVVVGAAILASGPVRDGLIGGLIGSPRFALELAFGFAAGLAAIWTGLESGVPGAPSGPRSWAPPLLLFCAWTLAIGYGLIHPNNAATMDGKRVHCFIETLLLSLPPLSVALYLLRGRILFARAGAGLLVGAAAAAIPALWMQVTCMIEPLHVLKFHLSPVFIIGLVGAILAHRTLPSV